MITVVLGVKLASLPTNTTAALLVTIDLGVHWLTGADLKLRFKLNWQLDVAGTIRNIDIKHTIHYGINQGFKRVKLKKVSTLTKIL